MACKMGVPGMAVLLLLAVNHCSARGDFEDFETPEPAGITPEQKAVYFTEMMVQSAGLPERQCSERVFAARRAAVADGKKLSLGVEPTVSLGAALLVFLGVGVFAIAIAQSFQMVSQHFVMKFFFSFYLLSTFKSLAIFNNLIIKLLEFC